MERHLRSCWIIDWYIIMKYPFIKCLSPRFIKNIYTGETILAECGKCESCLMKKSLSSTIRCKLESSVHRFTYFCTLTYAQEHLPLAELVEVNWNGAFADTYDMVTPEGEVLGTHTFMKHSDKMALIKKCGTPHNRLPYLRREDIQLFIKRLRKYINKYSNEKIRVFYCGEYGPVHFRPHFHLLLWFDKDKTSEIVHEAVHSCWPFGRVDSQLSSDKSASYVAGYLNSSCYLPRLFKLRRTSPFSHHSFYLGESVFQNLAEEIQSHEFERAARKRVYGNGINTDCILWRSLKARILPRCKGYSEKSEQERIFSYQLNEKLREWTQEDCPIYQARFITDYVRLYDFYSEYEPFNRVLQYFRMSYSLYDEYSGCRYCPYIVDWDKFERSVYIELLCARKYVRDICGGRSDLVPNKVRLIDEFYKYLDYENLKNQLDVEKTVSPSLSDSQMKYFFHNKLKLEDLTNEPIYRRFTSSRKEMYKSFMKHKELNDKNLFFSYI